MILRFVSEADEALARRIAAAVTTGQTQDVLNPDGTAALADLVANGTGPIGVEVRHGHVSFFSGPGGDRPADRSLVALGFHLGPTRSGDHGWFAQAGLVTEWDSAFSGLLEHISGVSNERELADYLTRNGYAPGTIDDLVSEEFLTRVAGTSSEQVAQLAGYRLVPTCRKPEPDDKDVQSFFEPRRKARTSWLALAILTDLKDDDVPTAFGRHLADGLDPDEHAAQFLQDLDVLIRARAAYLTGT